MQQGKVIHCAGCYHEGFHYPLVVCDGIWDAVHEVFHFPLVVSDGIWDAAPRATDLLWLVPQEPEPCSHGTCSLCFFPLGNEALLWCHLWAPQWQCVTLSISRNEQSCRPISQLLELMQHLGVGRRVLKAQKKASIKKICCFVFRRGFYSLQFYCWSLKYL